MRNSTYELARTGVKSIDNNVEYIRQYYITMRSEIGKKSILFLGLTNPCFFGFYEKLRKEYSDVELVWMRYKKNYSETFTHGFIIKIPSEISRINYHLLIDNIEITDNEKKKVEENSEYKWAFDNIMSVHPYDNPNMVQKTILLTEHYFLQVFDIIKPVAIIMWNPYVAFNKIAESVAKRRKIKVIYIESGILPGTISFSTWGDLGESRPSKQPDFFMKLPVSEKDFDFAQKIISFLRETGFNRNIQPKLSKKISLKKDRPTIFLAGQNDSECGLVPYNDKVRNYSPNFKSSEEALYYIAAIAYKNDWNIIYKPHPIVARRRLEQQPIPSNVIYVTQGNINELIDICDICVTILSTTAYVSLIREKPVVMLGKIQLNGQGCTYEAYNKEKIEIVIKDALKNGYSAQQKKCFVEHIARMNKYYQYDSLQERDIHYGRSINDAVSFINSVIEGEAIF